MRPWRTGTRFEASHFLAIPAARAGGPQLRVAIGQLAQRALVAGARTRGGRLVRAGILAPTGPFDPHQEA
jgi:hypothetical protein